MALRPESTRLYKELIDLVIKTPNNLRFDTLDSFAKRHGLSYGWVKKRAEALMYASYGGNFTKMPKTMRQDIKNIQEEMKSGAILVADAKRASNILITRTPLMDLERLNREYVSSDLEVLGMQKKIAEKLERLMERMINSGVHPVRAQARAWSLIGKKLHYELPKAIKEVPKNKLDEVIKNIWRANFLNSQAQYQYESARLDYMTLLRSYLNQPSKLSAKTPQFMAMRGIPRDADKIMQRYESDLKDVTGYDRPGGKRKRYIPTDVKRFVLNSLPLYRNGLRIDSRHIEDPFEKKLVEIGKHLKAGDKIYGHAKEIEEEKVSPFVRISKQRRR